MYPVQAAAEEDEELLRNAILEHCNVVDRLILEQPGGSLSSWSEKVVKVLTDGTHQGDDREARHLPARLRESGAEEDLTAAYKEVIRDFPPLDLAAVVSLCSLSGRKDSSGPNEDSDLVDLCMEQFDVQGSRHSRGARASALAAALVATNHSEDVDGLMRLLEFQACKNPTTGLAMAIGILMMAHSGHSRTAIRMTTEDGGGQWGLLHATLSIAASAYKSSRLCSWSWEQSADKARLSLVNAWLDGRVNSKVMHVVAESRCNRSLPDMQEALSGTLFFMMERFPEGVDCVEELLPVLFRTRPDLQQRISETLLMHLGGDMLPLGRPASSPEMETKKLAQIEMAARILCSLAQEAPQAFLSPPIMENLKIHLQAASCRCPMSCPVWSPEACEIQVNTLGCCLLHAASAEAEGGGSLRSVLLSWGLNWVKQRAAASRLAGATLILLLLRSEKVSPGAQHSLRSRAASANLQMLHGVSFSKDSGNHLRQNIHLRWLASLLKLSLQLHASGCQADAAEGGTLLAVLKALVIHRSTDQASLQRPTNGLADRGCRSMACKRRVQNAVALASAPVVAGSAQPSAPSEENPEARGDVHLKPGQDRVDCVLRGASCLLASFASALPEIGQALELGDQDEESREHQQPTGPLQRMIVRMKLHAAEDWQGFQTLSELLLQTSACCGWMMQDAPFSGDTCCCCCTAGESVEEDVAVLGLQALAAGNTRGHQESSGPNQPLESMDGGDAGPDGRIELTEAPSTSPTVSTVSFCRACYHLMERERAVANASRVSLRLATTTSHEESKREGAAALFGMARTMAPALDHDLELQHAVRSQGWLLEKAFGSRVIRPLPLHLWLWQPDAVPSLKHPPYVNGGTNQCEKETESVESSDAPQGPLWHSKNEPLPTLPPSSLLAGKIHPLLPFRPSACNEDTRRQCIPYVTINVRLAWLHHWLCDVGIEVLLRQICPRPTAQDGASGFLPPEETMALWGLSHLIEAAELCTDLVLQEDFLLCLCSIKVPIQQLESDEVLRTAKSLFEALLGCGPDARRAHEATHNMLRVECVHGILRIAASHDHVPGLVTRSVGKLVLDAFSLLLEHSLEPLFECALSPQPCNHTAAVLFASDKPQYLDEAFEALYMRRAKAAFSIVGLAWGSAEQKMLADAALSSIERAVGKAEVPAGWRQGLFTATSSILPDLLRAEHGGYEWLLSVLDSVIWSIRLCSGKGAEDAMQVGGDCPKEGLAKCMGASLRTISLVGPVAIKLVTAAGRHCRSSSQKAAAAAASELISRCTGFLKACNGLWSNVVHKRWPQVSDDAKSYGEGISRDGHVLVMDMVAAEHISDAHRAVKRLGHKLAALATPTSPLAGIVGDDDRQTMQQQDDTPPILNKRKLSSSGQKLPGKKCQGQLLQDNTPSSVDGSGKDCGTSKTADNSCAIRCETSDDEDEYVIESTAP